MKMAYYPGCSQEGSSIEYGLSTERTAELMGVELVEIEDWNCCGATSGHNTNKLLSLALPARNLAIAEKTGLDILVPCAACYNRFRTTELTVREDSEMREKIEQLIDMEYEAKNETISVLDLLANKLGPEKIKENVKQPLKAMKAACYYGCLLVRPVHHTGFDDPEDPQTMDTIVQALGAETVDWSHKTECCGAALATSRPEIGKRMTYEILKNARDAGAECIVTACPLCMMNLDMRQAGVENEFREKFGLPIYFVTELVAAACGDAPEKVGTNRHFVEAVEYLKSLPAKAAQMEAEEQEKKKKKTSKSEPANEEEAALMKKKIDAMVKAFEKNPGKTAKRIVEDEERAGILAEIISGDEKKTAKLAELMITDKEKAGKTAEALINGELKKRQKQQA